MSEERDNALVIARLEGEMKAIRAENEAMETRIDAKLTALGSAMDKQQATLLAEIAKRDKDSQRWTIGFGIAQIAITIAAIGGGVAILGLLISLPG